jgi:hypothetical protein
VVAVGALLGTELCSVGFFAGRVAVAGGGFALPASSYFLIPSRQLTLMTGAVQSGLINQFNVDIPQQAAQFDHAVQY